MQDVEGKEDEEAKEQTIEHGEKEEDTKDAEQDKTVANQKMKYESLISIFHNEIILTLVRLKMPEDKKKKQEKEKIKDEDVQMENEGQERNGIEFSLLLIKPLLTFILRCNFKYDEDRPRPE